MQNDIERLEVVYYASPIPHNLTLLTFLGLVFDRVYFPNVHAYRVEANDGSIVTTGWRTKRMRRR